MTLSKEYHNNEYEKNMVKLSRPSETACTRLLSDRMTYTCTCLVLDMTTCLYLSVFRLHTLFELASCHIWQPGPSCQVLDREACLLLPFIREDGLSAHACCHTGQLASSCLPTAGNTYLYLPVVGQAKCLYYRKACLLACLYLPVVIEDCLTVLISCQIQQPATILSDLKACF